jgi:hypothetical protein
MRAGMKPRGRARRWLRHPLDRFLEWREWPLEISSFIQKLFDVRKYYAEPPVQP